MKYTYDNISVEFHGEETLCSDHAAVRVVAAMAHSIQRETRLSEMPSMLLAAVIGLNRMVENVDNRLVDEGELDERCEICRRLLWVEEQKFVSWDS